MQSKLFATNHKTFDCIIVGGGPAGISCALELSYCAGEPLLIEGSEKLGGQLWQISSEIMDLPSGYFKDGPSVVKSMEKLWQRAGINVLLGQRGENLDAQKKTIQVGDEIYRAKTMVLATGYRLRRLDLPGLSSFQQDIIYRDENPASIYAGLRVAVLGAGDNALMKALDLAQTAEQVFLLNRSTHWRARLALLKEAQSNARIEIIENTELQSLSGASRLSGARLIDRSSGRIRNLSLDKLFVKIGYMPNTEGFSGQLALDSSGHVLTNKWGKTSVDGIYAAGDIVACGSPRIATAYGDGLLVAHAVQIQLGTRLSAQTASE